MSVAAAVTVPCPVCKGTHGVLNTIVGYRVIACPDKKPTGDVSIFMKPDPPVFVIGAGVGVDVAPERPKTVEELQADINRLKSASVAPKEKTREELEAELAKLQGAA